jgi:hypothetical protein
MIGIQKTLTKRPQQKNEKSPRPEAQIKSRFKASQMMEAPETMRSDDVLLAQEQVGNQVVQRALDQGLTDARGNLREDISSQIQQKRGSGSPLPEVIQKEAAQQLGSSFKDVRIHTDSSADRLSSAINARAFTIGTDIFFKQGVFAPSTSAGRETLLHELTHVVQQRGTSASGSLKLGAPNTAHEKEAERVSKGHTAASKTPASSGVVQRTLRTGMEEASDLYDSSVGSVSQQTLNQGLGLAGDNPWDEGVADRGGTGGGIANIAVSGIGLGFDALGWHSARQKRSDPNTSAIGQEAAWKQEKTKAKGVGTKVMGIGAAGASFGGNIAGFAGGVATSSVDAMRNFYGMVRASHKARKLGGVADELGAAKADQNKPADERADAEKLQGVAQFAHKTKRNTALIKALGTVGAGLGVAAGAVGLAAGMATPVGWGLAAAGAGIGLGIGAYKLGRGMWKRSHRRDKLSATEKEMGITPQKAGAWSWMRGKDIEQRREAIKAKKEELTTAAAGGDQSAKDKLDALEQAQFKGQGNLYQRAMKTEKKRMAGTLRSQLAKEAGAGKAGTGYAQRIGRTLGVTNQAGQVVQSAGWKFWQKDKAVPIDQVDTNDKKQELDELFMRKMGSSN